MTELISYEGKEFASLFDEQALLTVPKSKNYDRMEEILESCLCSNYNGKISYGGKFSAIFKPPRLDKEKDRHLFVRMEKARQKEKHYSEISKERRFMYGADWQSFGGGLGLSSAYGAQGHMVVTCEEGRFVNRNNVFACLFDDVLQLFGIDRKEYLLNIDITPRMDCVEAYDPRYMGASLTFNVSKKDHELLKKYLSQNSRDILYYLQKNFVNMYDAFVKKGVLQNGLRGINLEQNQITDEEKEIYESLSKTRGLHGLTVQTTQVENTDGFVYILRKEDLNCRVSAGKFNLDDIRSLVEEVRSNSWKKYNFGK